MTLIIGLLTLVLVLDAIFLIFLIMLQLPKKDAGIGTAFGGGTTDALFGPGAGNILTKLTKWSAVVFLGLALTLSVINAQRGGGISKSLKKNNSSKKKTPETPFPFEKGTLLPSPANTNKPATTNTPSTNSAPATNKPAPPSSGTNSPAKSGTNSPAKK
ncbi:MAG: preprotein translocase subunit SecG [Pedosphaera sp.]|nr:preprotein translocase subunit SecG [Pedosphaera sp.]